MSTTYEKDVILWSQEQARALRKRDFSKLDIEHLADEIEDVGKSEKRELASRMVVLLAHLLKWSFQPTLRGKSWRNTITVQRDRIALSIKGTPSLKSVMREPDWQKDVWLDATLAASNETGRDPADFGATWPWPVEQVLDSDFWPD